MSKVLVHASINIRKNLLEMLRDSLKEFNKTHDENVFIETSSSNEAENWLMLALKENIIPELAVAHATDFAPVSDKVLKETFQSLPGRYPLRIELKNKKFQDPEGIFHPVALVPFVIIGNTRLLSREEMPVSWQDLLHPKWYHQVVFPEAVTPIAQLVTATLKKLYPESFAEFYPTINYNHSPVEVVKAIGDGAFPLGISNLGFSKMVPRNIASIVPEEGAICSPLVLVCSRAAGEPFWELANVLYNERIQEMFTQQGFIPASPDVSMTEDTSGRTVQFFWEGWEQFFNILRKEETIS